MAYPKETSLAMEHYCVRLCLPVLLFILSFLTPAAVDAEKFFQDDRVSIAADSTDFAADIYAARSASGNVVFAPLSLWIQLALAYAGARSDTAIEMAKALHFSLPPERLHPALAMLLQRLTAGGINEPPRLLATSSLWVQKGTPLQKEFLSLASGTYGSEVREADFVHGSKNAAGDMNRWAAKSTSGRIDDLVPMDALNANTRVILLNTIYFKGVWADAFSPYKTRDEDFHVTAGQTVKVPMMHRSDDLPFNYFEDQNFQALELPYRDNNFSMVILLPREAEGMSKFEKQITGQHLQFWLAHLSQVHKVQVSLPKFHVTATLDLVTALQSAGMKRAFSSTEADFSAIDGGKDLYISALIQQAMISVDENGTEASAGTYDTMMSLGVGEAPPPVFRADHPFVFLLRDRRSGAILFLGRVINPAASSAH